MPPSSTDLSPATRGRARAATALERAQVARVGRLRILAELLASADRSACPRRGIELLGDRNRQRGAASVIEATLSGGWGWSTADWQDLEGLR